MRLHPLAALARLACASILLFGLNARSRAEAVQLSSLDLSKALAAAGAAPIADKAAGDKPLSIAGKAFEHGVSMNGYTVLYLNLAGGSDRFTATLGIDDASSVTQRGGGRRGGRGGGPAVRAATFRVLGDGRSLREDQTLRLGEPGVAIDVDVKGIKLMALVVAESGGRRGAPPVRADWAEAKLAVSGAKPETAAIPADEKTILTPPAGPEPRINGPALTGVTPGHQVLYKIPVTGTKPIVYAADHLPDGLKLDPATGVITGVIKDKGKYPVVFRAKNSLGETSRPFTFDAEGKLALTPALGWNSWNVFGRNVSDELVRKAADATVDKGLIDHGWTYVNIDDGWQRDPNRGADQVFGGPARDEKTGAILPNSKFPDMKALTDYVHAKGLKIGTYSSPGPVTCQRLEASWQHEEQDAKQWADWGFDYIKYDWCSYTDILDAAEKQNQQAMQANLPLMKRPYQAIRAALNKTDRDIILSLCQYGWGEVWKWGAEPDIEGNSWRTTGDITDNWQSMSTIGFNQVDLAQYAGPGHWNDPDMLVVGKLGWGSGIHETHLTPSEQYVHITLWTLYSSPMLIGCDMTQMDDFTLGLLTNDEVLAIHQDELGKTASPVVKKGNTEVWSRPLADGSIAVGYFNRDEIPMQIKATWKDLGISGKQTIRDVWRQKDAGTNETEWTAEIPRHGCALFKISPAKN